MLKENSSLRRTTKRCFLTLVVIGLLLRVIVGTQSLGFVHPDEHQQYLEAANKIAYGYGVTYWEYERGIRHYLYPGTLAGILKTLDAVQLTSPVRQAQVIRTLMGISVFATLVWYSSILLRDKKGTAAFSLLTMAAICPFFLFVGARTLSETAVIPLLVLMLIFLDRHSWISGILGGIMFAVRFQSALFVAPLFFAMLAEDMWRSRTTHSIWRRCVPFAVGCLASLLLTGWIDRVTWGSWFHSPMEYYRANVLEHIAASFGVTPWYQYIIWVFDMMVDSSISILPLALIGAWARPKYAFALVVFVVAHSCIGHKEYRFLWPMAPVVLVFIAEGVEAVLLKLPENRRPLGLAFAASLLLISTILQYRATDWHMGQTETSSLALAKVGEFQNVSGVALLGADAFSGNYFYLRKDVPYIVGQSWKEITASPFWNRVNYLVASTPPPECHHVELVTNAGRLPIYRIQAAAALFTSIEKNAELK